jgi:hypothetical protein
MRHSPDRLSDLTRIPTSPDLVPYDSASTLHRKYVSSSHRNKTHRVFFCNAQNIERVFMSRDGRMSHTSGRRRPSRKRIGSFKGLRADRPR